MKIQKIAGACIFVMIISYVTGTMSAGIGELVCSTLTRWNIIAFIFFCTLLFFCGLAVGKDT